MKDPRALITGASGFTGRYLAPLLASRGYEIHGTSFRSYKQAGVDAMHVVNLCDRDCTKRLISSIQPDVVVHLAAVSQVRDVDSGDVYRTNITGTQNLLDALSAQSNMPKAVLLASSANVYGNGSDGIITESAPLDATSDYAVSKIAMEQMAWLYRARLPIVITRPFNYTGPGQRTDYLIPKIIDHVKRGEQRLTLGNMSVARDISDVRMVVDAYARLLRAESALGKVMNVCSGRAYSVAEILNIVEDIAGTRIEVMVDTALYRPNEVKSLRGSRSLLEACIGPVSVYDLRETIAWMLSA